LLYHHKTQELLLTRLAETLDIDTGDLATTLTLLAQNG
jgi:hypothetical protein